MKSLEQQLFTWNGWDGDPEMMVFYQPKLVRDLLPFKVGEQFDSATILYTKSILQLRRNDKYFEFPLILNVEVMNSENNE